MRSRRLTGGIATTSRGRREREVVARKEAKTKVKTEVQTATMTARLLVGTTTSTTQTNNQPTTGASECRGPFGEAQAEGRRQSHQRLVKTEVQTATMTARLLVTMTTSATQTNNQPMTGASKCRGLFGEARAEGRRQSHQRLRCLRSRDQQCNKSPRHQASADDRRWDDGPWCNRRRRCTIDRSAGGQGWEDEDNETG